MKEKKTKMLGLRVTEELKRKLELWAYCYGMSVSDLVHNILNDYFEKNNTL